MTKLVRNRLVLAVQDLALSTSYWIDKLGFHREFGDGSDGWSFLGRDAFSVMLGECPDEVPASDIGNHSYVSYVNVEDIDGLHADLSKRGAMITSNPANKPWGMREFGIRTPDGHRLQFGSALEG